MKICFWLMTFFIVNSLEASDVFKSQVTPSFELALSWVKKSPLPLPHFAHIITLATECGERAIKISSYEKSFALAFLLTLENLEPKWKGIVEEGIERNILPLRNIKDTVHLINTIEHKWIVRKKEALAVASQSLISSEFQDGEWRPTPPFPSYVSGHSTFSAAAATFLNAYGINLLTFSDEKGLTKSFSKAWSATQEAGKSRIYVGIHFETDNRDGLELGKRVACKQLKEMNRKCLY